MSTDADRSPGAGAVGEAGGTDLAALVRAIWSEVLGTPVPESDASFFALGGHSLLLARVAVRLRRALGVGVPLDVLYDAPTVELTVAAVRRLMAVPRPAGSSSMTGPPVTELHRAALTQQHRLLFNREMGDGRTQPVSVVHQLTGPLDVAALHAALSGAMAGHDALRIVFPRRPSDPTYAAVLPERDTDWPLRLESVQHWPAAQRDAAAETLLIDFCNAPHDLERGPLAAALLVRLAEDRHLLALSVDHLVMDGLSLELLLRDLGARYGARLRGGTAGARSSFVAYAAGQAVESAGSDGRRRRAYWHRVFDELGMFPPRLSPAPPLAPDPLRTGPSRTKSVPLPAGLLDAVSAAAARRGGTVFAVALAAVLRALRPQVGSDLLGAVFMESGRSGRGADELIGNLAHETQVWCRIPVDAPLEACVPEVGRQVAKAAAHSLPLWLVARGYRSGPGAVQEFTPDRLRERYQVPWLYFAYEPARPAGFQLAGVDVQPYLREVEVPVIRTPVFMVRVVPDSDGGHRLSVSFAAAAYSAPAVREVLVRAAADLSRFAGARPAD